MPRCYLSLGGNLGPVRDAFDDALARLAAVPGTSVIVVSRFHRTEPVGLEAGGEFLNAAAEIETVLSPIELLDSLQSIELSLGRKRSIRWGPRPIDLDLLFYGSEIIDLPRLVVPHPAAWYRRFVLDPLVEIAPHFVHPERQVDIQTLRARLLTHPLVAAFAGGRCEARIAMLAKLAAEFPNVRFVEDESANPFAGASVTKATFTFWLGTAEPQNDPRSVEFQQLPVVSRIDVTRASEPVDEFVRSVLRSALG
jgi:2-amino-4-hydroxy-6-hydroxymethyldihydropteridine diphosphokinase